MDCNVDRKKSSICFRIVFKKIKYEYFFILTGKYYNYMLKNGAIF